MNSRISKEAEAARYLGYGNAAPDDAVKQLMDECFGELQKRKLLKVVTEQYPLKIEQNHITIGPFAVESRHLAKNLAGCEQVIVFAATLGADIDRILRRYERTQIAKAAVMQACAAAELEEDCDALQEELEKEAAVNGYYLRPRFSPGYGDFPIFFQKEMLELLDAQKKIGLTLTDSMMLVPVKSVTAVIGLSREETNCAKSGCECCEKKDCPYRRDTIEEGDT